MAANPNPTPYVAIPTEHWDGIDGNWSTFRISVGGQPGQNFRVLVSTLAGQPWVPLPKACAADDQACPSARGVEPFQGQPSPGFQTNLSWDDLSMWSLDLEDRLGFGDGGGDYGRDKIRLGFGDDTDALEVNKTLAIAFAEEDYWMGLLGVGNVNTTLDNGKPIKSFIRDLNDTQRIPSLSYGYTAGVHYRYTKVPGSLVIGGYDQSRSELSPCNFSFTHDLTKYLVVGLQSIDTTFSLTATGSQSLVTNGGHFTLIDSSVSQLWLPEDICNNFAAAFGLTYDDESNYYLINDTMHKRLLKEDPTIKIRVGKAENTDGNDSVLIELPYAAFDHSISHPAYRNTTRYFPIRQARNSTQYTIGRVFLQEAYLTVDFERSIFSLAQARFDDPMLAQDIRTIHSKMWVDQDAPSLLLNSRAIAGIVIGATVGGFLILSIIYFYWWRPRRQAMMHKTAPELQPHWQKAELSTRAENQVKRPELDADNAIYELNGGCGSSELPAPVGAREVHGVVYEMNASHELTDAIWEANENGEVDDTEGRTSEQRGASGVQGPSS